ncbi:hypothetical protein BJV74DRAFT_135772 [Russula compacta]|nr:hypothetical protein BJV74DRAFT_135772 [Russula compacta]
MEFRRENGFRLKFCHSVPWPPGLNRKPFIGYFLFLFFIPSRTCERHGASGTPRQGSNQPTAANEKGWGSPYIRIRQDISTKQAKIDGPEPPPGPDQRGYQYSDDICTHTSPCMMHHWSFRCDRGNELYRPMNRGVAQKPASAQYRTGLCPAVKKKRFKTRSLQVCYRSSVTTTSFCPPTTLAFAKSAHPGMQRA